MEKHLEWEKRATEQTERLSNIIIFIMYHAQPTTLTEIEHILASTKTDGISIG